MGVNNKINDLGVFERIELVWDRYPEGGRDGDFVTVGGKELCWNKYNHSWADAEGVVDDSERENKTFDGNVTINHDLYVGGTVYASKVRQPNCGLFPTLNALSKAYPNPDVGMWACVGAKMPAPIYRCDRKGVWTATNEIGGVDNVTADFLQRVEQEVSDTVNKANDAKNSSAEAIQVATEAQRLANDANDGTQTLDGKVTSLVDTQNKHSQQIVRQKRLLQEHTEAFVETRDALQGLGGRISETERDLSNISSKIGTPNGLATLDTNGKVRSDNLPSYIDDIVEFADFVSSANIVSNGRPEYSSGQLMFVKSANSFALLESDTYHKEWDTMDKYVDSEFIPLVGKIFVCRADSKAYRWSGSTLIEVGSSDIIIGEVEGTAYDGGKGKAISDKVKELDQSTADINALSKRNEGKIDAVTEDLNNKVPMGAGGLIEELYVGGAYANSVLIFSGVIRDNPTINMMSLSPELGGEVFYSEQHKGFVVLYEGEYYFNWGSARFYQEAGVEEAGETLRPKYSVHRNKLFINKTNGYGYYYDGEGLKVISDTTTIETDIDDIRQDNLGRDTEVESLRSMLNQLVSKEYYGVEWDITVSNPQLTRIGKMELHRELPIQSKMRRCLLLDDGTVNYYLHPNDSTKKEDGTPAKLDGTDGQVMVEIPAFYVKFESEGNKRRCLMSEYPLAGFRRWDKIYRSAFEACIDTRIKGTHKLSSVMNDTEEFKGVAPVNDNPYKSGIGKPTSRIRPSMLRVLARNRGVAGKNGCGWNCDTYIAQRATYWLYVVEYANFNSQLDFIREKTAEGYMQGGLGNGATNLDYNLWLRHNNAFPVLNCGFSVGVSGNDSTVIDDNELNDGVFLHSSVYRGIENPFGHIHKFIDGCAVRRRITIIDNNQSPPEGAGLPIADFLVCDNPEMYGQYERYTSVSETYKLAGFSSVVIGGEDGHNFPLIPNGGSSSTYMCDYANGGGNDFLTIVLTGGTCAWRDRAGMGCFSFAYNENFSHQSIGTRLCFIP